MKRFGISMAMIGLVGHMVFCEEADGAGGDLPGAASVVVDETGATGKGVKPAPVEAKPQVDEGDAFAKAGFAEVEGDPGLNYAMRFLATNGFAAENPAVAAAFEGDFALLKAELAQKGIAGWEQALGLAEQSYERHVKANEAKAVEVGGIVTDLAEQMGVDWEQAVAHVASTAKPEERTALNSLLSDPATAHIAGHYITSAFINGGDTEIQPAAKAVGAAVGASGLPAGQPLSRREYTAEMGKLRSSLGEDYLNSPQAQALYRRLQR